MGEMKRAVAREEQERRNQDRFASTVVIAAAIIAAVRLARDDISSSSPANLCCSLGQCQLGAKDPTAGDRGMSAPGR